MPTGTLPLEYEGWGNALKWARTSALNIACARIVYNSVRKDGGDSVGDYPGVLQRLQDNQSKICANQLLGFLTLLDQSNALEELFRLASLGLQKSCHVLRTGVPAWMHGLLGKRKDNEWDDLCCRTTVRVLQRFGQSDRLVGPGK